MPDTLTRPNLLLIVLDTHRVDRIGAYGHPRGATPNLDAFARQAALYEQAISPAQWTVPSHASMFTGEFPTTHLTVHSGDMLDAAFQTAAERLRASGYATVGFCNNPLVGVIDNGLKRGFDRFYNYGGAVPSTPAQDTLRGLGLLSQVWERYTQLLRRISYPVQNLIAQSERVLHFTLNPLFVPLWTRLANFKGNTPRSIQDTRRFIEKKLVPGQKEPYFVFLNVMETHLPFHPPEPFLSRFAPLVREERAAQDFMRFYNTQALRWLLPMDEPFSPLEFETLSQMYDAEAAYQDHLLGALFETLDDPYHRANTAVIVVSDHGEMLGEHRLMGHSFGSFQELVHVPLMVRRPGQSQGLRLHDPVSTAQVFHTLLDLGRAPVYDRLTGLETPVERLSLARPATRKPAELVVSESYAPMNVIRILEKRDPGLLERFHCRATVRAAYNRSREKLTEMEAVRAWLANLDADPSEETTPAVPTGHPLAAGLETFVQTALERRPENWTRRSVTVDDQQLLQRLRDLGYVE